jgi:hypothetical protein
LTGLMRIGIEPCGMSRVNVENELLDPYNVGNIFINRRTIGFSRMNMRRSLQIQYELLRRLSLHPQFTNNLLKYIAQGFKCTHL